MSCCGSDLCFLCAELCIEHVRFACLLFPFVFCRSLGDCGLSVHVLHFWRFLRMLSALDALHCVIAQMCFLCRRMLAPARSRNRNICVVWAWWLRDWDCVAVCGCATAWLCVCACVFSVSAGNVSGSMPSQRHINMSNALLLFMYGRALLPLANWKWGFSFCTGRPETGECGARRPRHPLFTASFHMFDSGICLVGSVLTNSDQPRGSLSQ